MPENHACVIHTLFSPAELQDRKSESDSLSQISDFKFGHASRNKTGTSKVGAISKAQKAQDIKKKTLNFLKIFSENVA